MNDICEIICTAVDTIVSSKLEGLQYDITKLCTIVDDTQRNKGEYVVSDGSIRFQAFSTDTSFREGNSVLVVIPNGDYNMQKTISGRIAATNTEPFNYTSPMETMVKITGNIFDADDAIVQKGSLLANDITIKNNQEIAGTAIGPLYKITDQTGLSGFTRLGITADFRSWLNGLDVATGTYGLKIYIHANTSLNEEKRPVVYDLTFTNEDMYGNPYLFEDYFSQEKVFDISNIDEITEIEVYFYQSGNFKDGNGNLILYTSEFEGEKVKRPNNLFVDNVCIYLGYDVNAFSGETLMLTTNDLTTYTYQEVEAADGGKVMGNPNPVTMTLRWIHKVNDLEYQLLNQEQINTDKYELRWYHYVDNLASSDKYAGIGWELLGGENINLIHELDKDKQYEEFKVIGIIKQDPTIVQNEDGSVIEIENDGLVYTSNILRFTNENYSYSSEIDKNTGLSIVFMDETKGNYYLYNQNGYILNQGLGQGYTRTMKVMYHGAELVQAPDFNINYIIWYMPFEKSNIERFTDQHTMLVASEDYYSENNGEYKNSLTKQWLYTLSKNGTDYVGVKRDFKENDIILTQSFAIKNQWAQSNANNTVRVIVNINGIDYEASTELKFGKAGTQGTNRTLVLEYSSNENAVIAGGDGAIIEAIMYDYDGTRIGTSGTYTWGWVNNTSYLSIGENYGSYIKINCNTSTVPNNNYSILKCTYSPGNDEGGINLTSYLPIAIKDSNYSHIEGAREVIYNHQGVPSYYTDAYILYELDRTKQVPEYVAVNNAIWNIRNGENATGITQSYIPQLKEIGKAGIKYKALSAAPFYLKDYANKVCVSCSVGEEVVWSQPILIMQSQYDFAMLNEWDGNLTINEENGTILSTMLGAGRKNDDNTFSGVLIGDVKEGTGLYETETLTGVYGIHEGISSFALRENGTATFGKAGLGQIHIDGNESTIKSSSRNANNGIGMLIDLDDGIIDIKESENDTARLTLTSKNNTTLINVDNSNYYLQSDNYTDNNGMKIDLSNGRIQTSGNNGKVIIEPNSPYLQIQGINNNNQFKNLMYVGTNSYYLQSADYAENTNITNGKGIKIDLMNGKITGYNLYLAGYNNSGKSIVIDSGATYPLKIGSYFYVDYDGVLNCSGATIQNANIVNAHIENLTGDNGRDVIIGENFYISPSGTMTASGANINGNATVGGTLSAGNVSMSKDRINIGSGAIYAAGDGSIFIDPDVTSDTVFCNNLKIGGQDIGSELQEIWEGISALWDAIDNIGVPDHTHSLGGHIHESEGSTEGYTSGPYPNVTG